MIGVGQKFPEFELQGVNEDNELTTNQSLKLDNLSYYDPAGCWADGRQ